MKTKIFQNILFVFVLVEFLGIYNNCQAQEIKDKKISVNVLAGNTFLTGRLNEKYTNGLILDFSVSYEISKYISPKFEFDKINIRCTSQLGSDFPNLKYTYNYILSSEIQINKSLPYFDIGFGIFDGHYNSLNPGELVISTGGIKLAIGYKYLFKPDAGIEIKTSLHNYWRNAIYYNFTSLSGGLFFKF
jgi:hypothetical protein